MLQAQKRFRLSMFVSNLREYYQEIRLYLLLLLLPLVLCIVLFGTVFYIAQQQLNHQAEYTVKQFYNYASDMLDEVERISFVALRAWEKADCDGDLKGSPEDQHAFVDQLNTCVSCTSYVKNVYVILQKQQLLFSDQALYTYSSLPSLLARVGANETGLNASSSISWQIETDSHLMLPYYTVPIADAQGGPEGYLIVSLDREAFLNTNFGLDADFACFFNKTGAVVTSLPLPFGASQIDWNNPKNIQKLLGYPVKCIYINMGDFTYMVALSKADLYIPLKIISICFCLYALLIFIIGFLYLYRISARRYRQMSDLITAIPQETVSVPYQELIPLVQRSLMEAHTRQLNQAENKKSRTLYNILHHHYDKPSPAVFLQAGIREEDGAYYVGYISVPDMNNVALALSEKDDRYDIVLTIIHSTLREMCPDCLHFLSCQEEKEMAFLVSRREPEDFLETVIQLCKNVQDFLVPGYGIKARFSLSACGIDFAKLPDMFQQAYSLNCLAQKIDSPSLLLSQETLLKNGNVLIKGNFFRQEQILMNTLRAEQYDMIPSMLESILAEHVSSLQQSYRTASGRIAALGNILSESLLSSRVDGMDLKAAAQTISQADSVPSLNQATAEIYPEMARLLSVKRRQQPEEISLACRYIEENLSDQNLNVSAICEAAGISVQRLTPMFSAFFDMSIAKYVNDCRINQAKVLLTDKRMTVAEVAARTGYNSTDTLTRNFRKLEGLTPTEYRNLKL